MAPAETRVPAETAITLRVPLPQHCPLCNTSGHVLSANQTFDDGSCRSQFILRTGATDTPQLVVAEVPIPSDSCICKEVRSHLGVPIFDRVQGDVLTLSILLEAREDACTMFRNLRECAPGAEVRSIVSDGALLPEDTAWVGMDGLTDKQAEALVLACCHGYYETPREVEIETLADTCDISRQAFSHRLRQAERKVVAQICQGGKAVCVSSTSDDIATE